MSKEKDFFKTCFNTVASLEVKNESQAIAKEVVLSEIEQVQQENKRLNGVIQTYDILLKSNVEANKQLKLINQDHQQINGELRQANKLLNEQYIRLNKEYEQVKDNWNMLKEYIRKNIIYDDVGMKILDPSPLEDYMQELEGSDSNE